MPSQRSILNHPTKTEDPANHLLFKLKLLIKLLQQLIFLPQWRVAGQQWQISMVNLSLLSCLSAYTAKLSHNLQNEVSTLLLIK